MKLACLYAISLGLSQSVYIVIGLRRMFLKWFIPTTIIKTVAIIQLREPSNNSGFFSFRMNDLEPMVS
jgi:hypothetical protein